MALTGDRPAEHGRMQITTGWTIERLTPPSRLSGANGLRTGADGRIYVAQVAGSRVSAIDPDSRAIEAISPVGGAGLAAGPDGTIYLSGDSEGSVLALRSITSG